MSLWVGFRDEGWVYQSERRQWRLQEDQVLSQCCAGLVEHRLGSQKMADPNAYSSMAILGPMSLLPPHFLQRIPREPGCLAVACTHSTCVIRPTASPQLSQQGGVEHAAVRLEESGYAVLGYVVIASRGTGITGLLEETSRQYSPELYERDIVEVNTETGERVKCYVYHRPDVDRTRPVQDGDWCKRRA